MASTSLFFDIFGRDHGVGKMLDNVGGHATGMSSKFRAVGTAMGAGLLAVGAIVVKAGIDKMNDYTTAIAQVEAGLKSTNGVSGTTKQGIEDLAGSIQDYSGQSSDAILQSEALLLTFTNIKNVGPDKIFDQATVAAADMAAKLGGDAASQSILLGKALNDPIKGITALTRVGVSFTQAQKDQIKAMASSGNVLGAQKLILKELTTEFGGAAKAAGQSLPGQIAIAKGAFGDMAGSLLMGLLPALKVVTGAVTQMSKWMQANKGVVLGITIAVAILTAAFFALSIATTIAASPFLLIGLAIAALVAGVVIAYNNLGWFKDGVNAVFGFITQVIGNVVRFIQTYMVPIWVIEFQIIANIVKWLYTNVVVPYIGFIISVISGIVNFITGTFVPGITAGFHWVGSIIVAAVVYFLIFRAGVAGVINGVIAFVTGLAANVAGFFGRIGSIVSGAVSYFYAFAAGVSGAVGTALNVIGSIPGMILGVFAGAGGWLVGVGAQLIGGLISGVSGMIDQAVNAVQNVGGAMLNGVKSFLGIKSPSKRAHDEVGLMFGAGVIGGIEASASDVFKATSRLVKIPASVGADLHVSASSVARQVAGARPGGSAGAQAQRAGDIYVQNPFTGEYMLAKVDEHVNGGINNANDYAGRRPSR